jgi:hypothetical protein
MDMDSRESSSTRNRYGAIVSKLIRNQTEGPWYEFKSNLEKPESIGQYISALANSAALHDKNHGYIIWGIDDESHEIIGTTFDHEKTKIGNQSLQPWLCSRLKPVPSLDFHYLTIEGKRVALLEISRASQTPVIFQNIPYIRIGSHVKKLHDHPVEAVKLYKKLDKIPFELHDAKSGIAQYDIDQYLDVDSYYSLQRWSIQKSPEVFLKHIENDKLILRQEDGLYTITNLGALLFARDLRLFPALERKAPRVIKYKGSNKIDAEKEQIGLKGYATGFKGLIKFIQSLLPANEHIGSALRVETTEYPPTAIRELVANALIHQDFAIGGAGPMIEIYRDRLEISNPGVPLVDPMRFVDNPPRSRNEKLASMMRRVRICEERGSGWDRIAREIELYQLPAPEVKSPGDNTVVTLRSPRKLSDMDNDEKIRAVYLHACLQQVSDKPTTNRTIRNRFKLTDKQSSTASSLLKLALDAGQIVVKNPNAGRKNMEYQPCWATPTKPSS